MSNPQNVLQQALTSKVRRIVIETRRVVDSTLAGMYHSMYKGQGLAFESVRPYEPGDDIRNLDWNVTARTNEAHTKRFIEERELTVAILFDSSASSAFGTVNRSKRELAAVIGAALALAAIANDDKVGLMLFSDTVNRYIRPRKGSRHALHLIREMVEPPIQGNQTDIGQALRVANQLLKQRSIVFVISDFLMEPQNYFQQLLLLNQRHDLVSIVVTDPLEAAWQNVGLVAVNDMETGEQVWVDSGSRRWRRHFQEQAAQLHKQRDEALRRARVDYATISVEQDYEQELVRFFRRRLRRH
jgi:uncharacterized protein (DUF58 family)